MMVFAIVGAVLIFLIIIIYNGIIHKKNEVENAEGGLDAQLKQRYDLIPNLVSSVQKYMQHEAQLLERIVKLRSEALKTDIKSEAHEKINQEISQQLSGLMVQVEQYPDLKSNENFIQLQKSLYEVEENIAAARRYYNAAITQFNNALEMFPSNILAKQMKLTRKRVFNIPEMEKKVPQIKQLFKN
jgi:LemA protein